MTLKTKRIIRCVTFSFNENESGVISRNVTGTEIPAASPTKLWENAAAAWTKASGTKAKKKR